MIVKRIKFSQKTVKYYFDTSFSQVEKLVQKNNAVIITDKNVFSKHKQKFKNWNTIVLKPGEQYKIQATVDAIIQQLIALKTDRNTYLIGVGGGVITDITGYVAAVYLRSIRFGFVPTSLLAMVDASIGGKNGIDVGLYKNMVGTITQPEFLLYDYSFLKTLPLNEWQNGFAEIIKHACIVDAKMFQFLQLYKLSDYRKNIAVLAKLVQQNALLKSKIVQEDEFELNKRKLLNFGHTLGHAIENTYQLSHGQAISVGMAAAAFISEKLGDFTEATSIVYLLKQYGLPTHIQFDVDRALEIMKSDKKKDKDDINYILLEKIGKAIIKPLPIKKISSLVHQFAQ